MTVRRLPDPQRIPDHRLFVSSGHFSGDPAPDRQYFTLIGKADDEQRKDRDPRQYVADNLAQSNATRKQGASNQHQRTDREHKIDILVLCHRSDVTVQTSLT